MAQIQYAGVDLSLVASGVVRRVGVTAQVDEYEYKTEANKWPCYQARIIAISAGVVDRVRSDMTDRSRMDLLPPERVVIGIEGYSYGSKNERERLGGLGERVRCALWEAGCGWYDIPPSVLKKFVLGKGVGEKNLMLQQILKRWGFEARTNNTGDAFACSLLVSQLHAQGEKHPLWRKVQYTAGRALA